MIEIVKIYLIYIKCISFYIFNFNKNSNEYIAATHFFNNSFRLKENSKKQTLILLKSLLKANLMAFNKKYKHLNTYNSILLNEEFIYEQTKHNYNLRIDYLKYYNQNSNYFFYAAQSTERYVNKGFILYNYIIGSIFFPFIFALSYLNKKSQNLALIYYNVLEIYQAIKILKIKGINKVNYFCIYENDSNINYLIFKKHNIYVSKIPSEVPLAFFNKNILTDKLIICFPYQLEELEEFKKTMKVKETELWGPERYHENETNYSKVDIDSHHILKNICYYSSANWYRKIKGNIDLGKFEKENEDLIIKTLITWVKQNPSYSLTIYLHPLERNHKIFKMVQEHYLSYQYSDLIIWDNDKASNQSFQLNNIGVGLYSTILFERIFMGFKTIIVPLGFENEFPLSNSNIVNICANSAKQLVIKMDSNINLSSNEYYEKNELNRYKNMCI